MGRLMVAWLLGVGVPVAPPAEPASGRFEFTRVEMAVPIRIVLYSPDVQAATRAAEAAFGRVAELNAVCSDYDPKSELRRLCDTAGEGSPRPVSDDLWRVLRQAQAVAQRTEGAFDVTVGPLVRLWRRARRRRQFPAPDRLDDARALVGYRFVRFEPGRKAVELLKPGMRLDLGGIAKGYAIDEALKVLRKRGCGRALVDAGGDVALGDPPPHRPGWRIGIAPLEADGPPTRSLTLANLAVATSGDTWQYVEIDGRRYSHIIDPRTGLALTDHSSVTVVAANGITADSLASAVSVLGPEKGLPLIDETPGTAALVVRAPEGEPQIYTSKRWKELQPAQEVESDQ